VVAKRAEARRSAEVLAARVTQRERQVCATPY
jgi:hypothetical protein